MFGCQPLLGGQQVNKFVHLGIEERPAALDMLYQRMGLILGNHADAPDAGIQAIGQSKIDDAELTPEMYRGFGAFGGQPF